MLKYAALDILGAGRASDFFEKSAHRADFSKIPRKSGYLYVRSRAISSRCNENFDLWPAEELKKSWATFIGKPVFVNHRNDNHKRARGVIVSAVLHEDINPDGSPDTWVEVLQEIDAVRFPMLAKLIIDGEVDRTSMGCFIPGTPITMADGTHCAIETLAVGDQVLTHGGTIESINHVMKRPYRGVVYDIKVFGQASPLVMTPEHPVWVQRSPLTRAQERRRGIDRRSCLCICGREFISYHAVGAHLREVKRQGHSGEHGHPEDELQTEWIQAADLQNGDWVFTPKMVGIGHPGSYPFARLLGFYLAEGNFGWDRKRRPDGPVTVEWNFHEDEVEYVQEVVTMLEAMGYRAAGPYIKNSCASIRCNSPELADRFLEYGGKYSARKCLHPEVLQWTPENQRALLDAYWQGDARRLTNRCVEVTTTSKSLAEQLHVLEIRCGIPATPPTKSHPPSTKKLGHSPFFVTQAVLEPLTNSSGEERSNLVKVDDDGLWRQVTGITIKEYEGNVYNFDVDGDDSYVASDVSVHNCDVSHSECTVCGNRATTPLSYCEHVRHHKGKVFKRVDGTQVICAERCFGVSFFENSILVEDPADPTAIVLGVDSGDMAPSLAARDRRDRRLGDTEHHGDVPLCQLASTRESFSGRGQGEQLALDDTDLPFAQLVGGVVDPSCAPSLGHHVRGVVGRRTQEPVRRVLTGREVAGMAHEHAIGNGSDELQVAPSVRAHTAASSVGQREASVSAVEGSARPRPAGVGSTTDVDLGEVPLQLRHAQHRRAAEGDEYAGEISPWTGYRKDWGNAKQADTYQERTKAPPDVDTLREDRCPVCGAEGGAFDGARCSACGYLVPPDFLQDPEVDVAGEIDDEQESEDFEDAIESQGEDPEDHGFGSQDEQDQEKHDQENGPGSLQGDEEVEGDDAFEDAEDPEHEPTKPGKPDPKLPVEKVKDKGDQEAPSQDGDVKKRRKPKKGSMVDANLKALTEAHSEIKRLNHISRRQAAQIGRLNRHRQATAKRATRTARHLRVIEEVVTQVANVAGINKNRLAAIVSYATKKADTENPGQPVPEPSAGAAPGGTTEEARTPDGTVPDPNAPGAVQGLPDARAGETGGDLQSPGGVVDEPLSPETEVTVPVAGTTEVDPAAVVEPEVSLVENPDQSVFNPIEPAFSSKQTNGQGTTSRAMASVRLARLRIATGVEADGEDADLVLAQRIESSTMPGVDIAKEIATLERVKQANAREQAPTSRSVRRAPRIAQRSPSLAPSDARSVTATKDDDEFALFE